MSGALAMVLAAFFFAAMSAAVKASSAEVPTAMVVFFRNWVALAVLLPWALREGRERLKTRVLKEHLVRGLFGLAAMSLFFIGLAHLRLADAVLLNYTLPLFLPAIERLWLREPIPRGLWTPLGVGFVGILLILKPGTGLFQPMALLVLLSALLAATAQVGIRRLTATESVTKIVFYFAVIATAVSAPTAIAVWRSPRPVVWVWLIACGALATAGQIFLTRAYAGSPAARVGPFLYTSVVFSGLLDWAIWGVLPDALFLVGALVVVSAAVLALRLQRETPRAPEPSASEEIVER